MGNWDRKQEMACRAQEHTADMDRRYGNEISTAIKNSKVFTGPLQGGSGNQHPIFVFVNTDSVDATFIEADGNTAIVNFASYRKPGGMFIGGSLAQEEAMCHESFLYNVLRAGQKYYEKNIERLNRNLYTDRAIYSPGIRFFHKGKEAVFGVLTCAAPNWKAASQKGVTSDENAEALRQRIAFVRDVADRSGVETLVFGAFGCGVFGQEPATVCEFIKEVFKDTTFVRKLVLAVPGDIRRDRNAACFKAVFG